MNGSILIPIPTERIFTDFGRKIYRIFSILADWIYKILVLDKANWKNFKLSGSDIDRKLNVTALNQIGPFDDSSII